MSYIFFSKKNIAIQISALVVWIIILLFSIQYNIYHYQIREFMASEQLADETYLSIVKVRDKHCMPYKCYSSAEFVYLYDSLDAYNFYTTEPQGTILSSGPIDNYLRSLAESVGYRKRKFINRKNLVFWNGLQGTVELRDAYFSLRDDLSDKGIDLHLVSAYRSFAKQRDLFLRGATYINEINSQSILNGKFDAEIFEKLETSAIPGYSKHHSGNAADFACGSDYELSSFKYTECYKALSESNFALAKKHGFVPSYPEGVANIGPNPEAWEFVYVGTEHFN